MPSVEPSVRFTAFTDLGIRCSVSVRAKTFADQFLVRHELIKRLHAALQEAGIGMATLERGQRSEVKGQR
jgi:small-conductance mechanosensitive channel